MLEINCQHFFLFIFIFLIFNHKVAISLIYSSDDVFIVD